MVNVAFQGEWTYEGTWDEYMKNSPINKRHTALTTSHIGTIKNILSAKLITACAFSV